MPTRYRIRAFAELTGVTIKTLQHYDRLGLLTPMRTDAGYRLYDSRDHRRLRRIVALKRLGIPLKQIGSVLAGGDPAIQAAIRRDFPPFVKPPVIESE